MKLFRGTGQLERRRAPRYTPDDAVSCEIRDPRADCSCTAAIRDISLTGIALVVARPFEAGQLLTIELRHAIHGSVRRYLLEVRHADICCPNDSWLHGCRFVRPLRGDELCLWL